MRSGQWVDPLRYCQLGLHRAQTSDLEFLSRGFETIPRNDIKSIGHSLYVYTIYKHSFVSVHRTVLLLDIFYLIFIESASDLSLSLMFCDIVTLSVDRVSNGLQ